LYQYWSHSGTTEASPRLQPFWVRFVPEQADDTSIWGQSRDLCPYAFGSIRPSSPIFSPCPTPAPTLIRQPLLLRLLLWPGSGGGSPREERATARRTRPVRGDTAL
jgi:hypothetical protein